MHPLQEVSQATDVGYLRQHFGKEKRKHVREAEDLP